MFPPYFNELNEGPVSGNMECSDEFEKDLILNINIVR
jgi:hypothetical protein